MSYRIQCHDFALRCASSGDRAGEDLLSIDLSQLRHHLGLLRELLDVGSRSEAHQVHSRIHLLVLGLRSDVLLADRLGLVIWVQL